MTFKNVKPKKIWQRFSSFIGRYIMALKFYKRAVHQETYYYIEVQYTETNSSA